MLTYYFYKNIKKNLYKTNLYLFLFSFIFEIQSLLFNLFYLNKFFFNMSTSTIFINKKIKFNFNIFFNKINIVIKIFRQFFNINRKIKSWKSLIIFFLTSLNSFISKSLFSDFDFNIKLNSFNMINYSFSNKVSLFKIKKRPGHFSIFYFFMHIYKIFIASKYSLLLLKNFIYLNFEIVLLFKLIKVKSHVNFKFKNLIYI